MSHFTCAVFTHGIPCSEEIDDKLLPYMENSCAEPPREFMEWYSIRDKYAEKYENDTVLGAFDFSGNFVSKYDKKFTSDMAEQEYPVKLAYPTFESYMEDYCGYYFDEEMQDYGYWQNPNAKWDWYEIGGRWSGSLEVRDDDGKIMKVDSASIKDLVFDERSMKYAAALRFWELYIDGAEPANDEEREQIEDCFYKKEYYTSRYRSKEEYAECQASPATYAFVDYEGEWHETGDMGWWGMDVSALGQEAQYDRDFEMMLADAGDDDWITIVDCHI